MKGDTMSKKIKNAITTTTEEVVNETLETSEVLDETTPMVETTTPETTPVVDLKSLMEQYPNVSLRKLALSLELSYGWILKCSKKPITGQPYDPDAINYDEVQKTFERKGIDLTQLDWESLNESTQTSRGILLTKDMSAFEVGQKVYLREDNEVPFDICYKTATHIVIMKQGDTEPRAWSHSTFLMKGPVFEPRTTHDNNDPDEALDEAEAETVQDILDDILGGEEA
jgi:hypothetical protein